MALVIIGVVSALLAGCVDVSLTRHRGETKNGYTEYTTILHVQAVDEPACVGSCKP